MAEEKKPEKKPEGKSDKKPDKKPAGGSTNDQKAMEEIIVLLIGLILLGAVASGVTNFIENLGIGSPDSIWGRTARYFLENVWPVWKSVAVLVSGAAVFGIAYSLWNVQALAAAEAAIFSPKPVIAPAANKNDRWEKILALANSNVSSDWRLAIIEADIFLEESLKKAGYLGDNIGEILQSLSKGDLLTLEAAWDAHKVRNRIAHDGDKFDLSDRETRRVIALFESVLKELKAI